MSWVKMNRKGLFLVYQDDGGDNHYAKLSPQVIFHILDKQKYDFSVGYVNEEWADGCDGYKMYPDDVKAEARMREWNYDPETIVEFFDVPLPSME